ncbi:MAG: ribosome biogenesis GTPase Der [Pseudomonadota bacterium]
MSADLPVVVIAGRPNVGKSTLFNALTRTRDALVVDHPGVTRDRIYGRARLLQTARTHSAKPAHKIEHTLDSRPSDAMPETEHAAHRREVLLVDTGGLDPEPELMNQRAQRQTQLALDEADLIVLVVDGRGAASAEDLDIADDLRKRGTPLVVAVNKTDGMDEQVALAEFSALGLGELIPIAAAHRRGLDRLALTITAQLALPDRLAPLRDSGDRIRLALIGRPNVGKSTLLNQLLGDERAVTADQPGTTRDPVEGEVTRDGRHYHLVDTAGIRRRRSQHEQIESLSTLKALQAMSSADVVCLLLDATEGVTDQDARLAGHAVDAGRAIVIVLNKWDGLNDKQRRERLQDVGEKLKFVLWAPVVILSALHGSGLAELTDAVNTVYDAACQTLSSGKLSRTLNRATEAHPPPIVQRFAPKLRFAHPGGNFPTRVVIHGNRTEHVADSYRRYLVNRFREDFALVGVPIRLLFRDSDNPYAGRKNQLTPRQIKRRQRIRKR